MKRSVAIILIIVISVAAIALVAGIGKGAMTVIGQMGDIFGSGGGSPDLPITPGSPDLPTERETSFVYPETNIYIDPFETEPPITEGELKFDGLALTMLLPDNEPYRKEWGQKGAQDELDEAVKMRNDDVLKDLDVEILYKCVPEGVDEFFELALQDVLNDEHNYDIAVNDSTTMSRLAVRGALSDLRDSKSFPFIDLTQPWWSASATENLTVGGKLYFTTGFFSLNMLNNVSVIFLNATMYDKNRANTDPENLQVYANEGNWTYEEMYRMTNAFSASMPNDDVLIIDREVSAYDIMRSFAAAFEARAMRRSNNSWEYNLVSNSRAEDVLTRTRELYSIEGVTQNESTQKFVAGESLFLVTKLYKDFESNLAIREMDDKYALMPLPKYNTAQEQYKAHSSGASFIGALGQTHSIAVSAFLEKTAERSHYQVLGYYFNRVVKAKYFSTGELEPSIAPSITAFDAIIYNIEFEFCNVYSSELGGIGNIWRDAYTLDITLEQTYNVRVGDYRRALDELNSRIGK